MQANVNVSFTCGQCSTQLHGSDAVRLFREHKHQSPNCFMINNNNNSSSSSSNSTQTTVLMRAVQTRPATRFVRIQPTTSTTRFVTIRKEQPVRKGMATLTARFQSYKNWPLTLLKSDRLSPLNMSSAGLFYTGKSDLVKCFSCGIEIKRWDTTTDDPWTRHTLEQRREYGCDFLRDRDMKQDRLPLEPMEGITTSEDLKCRVCMEEKFQIVFLPCKHMSTCEACSVSVSKCIICRVDIHSYMRIFLC